MTRRILIGSRAQYETLVSDDDYPILIKHKWTFKISSRKYANHVYARRCISRGGIKKTVLLAHVILEMQGKRRRDAAITSDHINNDTLDNRRENLRWANKRTQSKNQRRWK